MTSYLEDYKQRRYIFRSSNSLLGPPKFGDIESVKATSGLLSPVSGEVVKVNEIYNVKPQNLEQRKEKAREGHREKCKSGTKQ
jgi:hypothetical protein